MTSFEIVVRKFDDAEVGILAEHGGKLSNWPVVYTLNDGSRVYVGETSSATSRLRQHLRHMTRRDLREVRIVVDPTFNKSACLDLESQLIQWFHADERLRVLNISPGVIEADYYDRPRYQATFDAVFDALREARLFERTLPEIENSALFKLSPFKALTNDQAIAIEDILEGLVHDLSQGNRSTAVVQGDPGTGKTVVGVYLMKLLSDIRNSTLEEAYDQESIFAEYFTQDVAELLEGRRIGFVVPQQSLRRSVKDVFRKTPGLSADTVLTAFDVGAAQEDFDLLVVDEAHRLNQRANQPSGVQNKLFREITERLYGQDDFTKTQLDWIRDRSAHQIFLADANQSVRPADLPPTTIAELIAEAKRHRRHYPLTSQMRVKAGSDYVAFIRALLLGGLPDLPDLGEYEFAMFDDLRAMHNAIRERDAEYGLARLGAGYAWEWVSKDDPSAPDIVLDGYGLQWNRTQTDWANSPNALEEVGSIHTLQGYDLNYAGVIIGGDLRYSDERGLYFDRGSYFDRKGMENNARLGITYTDEDLLRYVTNVYRVLLTRGIRGTFVYVVDPGLRTRLAKVVPAA